MIVYSVPAKKLRLSAEITRIPIYHRPIYPGSTVSANPQTSQLVRAVSKTSGQLQILSSWRQFSQEQCLDFIDLNCIDNI